MSGLPSSRKWACHFRTYGDGRAGSSHYPRRSAFMPHQRADRLLCSSWRLKPLSVSLAPNFIAALISFRFSRPSRRGGESSAGYLIGVKLLASSFRSLFRRDDELRGNGGCAGGLFQVLNFGSSLHGAVASKDTTPATTTGFG